MRDFNMMCLFPKKYKSRVWQAVEKRWRELGEGCFAQYFKARHIDANNNWNIGALDNILGLATDNNPLEGNNPGLRRLLKAALRERNSTDRLPIATAAAFELLFTDVIPCLSQRAENEHADFEMRPEVLQLTKDSAAALAQDELFVKLPDSDVFILKQFSRDGRLHKVTSAEVGICLGLYQRLDCEACGEQGVCSRHKSPITYDEIRLLSACRFVSDNGCFPCKDHSVFCNCYHVMARLARLGRPPVTTNQSELGTGKVRGRKREYSRKRNGFKSRRQPNLYVLDEADESSEVIFSPRFHCRIVLIGSPPLSWHRSPPLAVGPNREQNCKRLPVRLQRH